MWQMSPHLCKVERSQIAELDTEASSTKLDALETASSYKFHTEKENHLELNHRKHLGEGHA